MTSVEIKGDNLSVVTVGAQGPQGIQGAAGQGVPTGGLAGQVLRKASNANYNTYWADPPIDGLTATVSIMLFDGSAAAFSFINGILISIEYGSGGGT